MVFFNKTPTPDYCAIDNDVQFQLNGFDESLRYCNLNTQHDTKPECNPFYKANNIFCYFNVNLPYKEQIMQTDIKKRLNKLTFISTAHTNFIACFKKKYDGLKVARQNQVQILSNIILF